MLITKTSQLSGKQTTRDLPVTEEQLKAYKEGVLVQIAFKNLSAADREWIRSGITEEEWKDLYGDEKDLAER